jgi:hypothetical protein
VIAVVQHRAPGVQWARLVTRLLRNKGATADGTRYRPLAKEDAGEIPIATVAAAMRSVNRTLASSRRRRADVRV